MKRAKLMLGILCFVALWPLVHRGLAAHYEIHPWRLGGFAMYTSYSKTFAILTQPTAGGFELLDEESFSDETRARLETFRNERSALGRLRLPHDVAEAAFAEQPELESLMVVVQRMTLDPSTALVAQTKRSILYERQVFLETGEATLEFDLN